MNRRNKLKSATAEELVEYFIAIAVVQDKATRQGENAKYNRLYKEMDAVEQELKQRTVTKDMHSFHCMSIRTLRSG
jgi:Domain of unknown function (DUF2019)